MTAGEGNNLHRQIAHDSGRMVSFPKHEFRQLIRWDISLADSILCLAKRSQGPQRLTCLQILYVCVSHPNINTSSVVNTHTHTHTHTHSTVLNLQGQFRCEPYINKNIVYFI